MSAQAPPRLRLRLRRVAGAPVVAARGWLRGGALVETVPGTALVTGRMLAEGTARRSWQRIAAEAEDRGMALDSFGSHEAIGVSVDALAHDWRRALAWLAELLLEPTFPEQRVHWIRRQAAAELDSLLDQGDARTGRAFLEQLYTPHPYGRALYGGHPDLARLTRDHCLDFHRRSLAYGAVVVITGEIDEDAVRDALAELLQPLAGGAMALPAMPAPSGLGGTRRRVAIGPGDQAHLFMGHLSVPRNHPDRPALELLSVVLGAGSGLAGRLPERIRERDALAYQVAVATTAGAGLDRGRLSVYLGTGPETAARAERAVRDELRRLVGDGLDDDELEDARAFLIGSQPFRYETARQWADRLAEAAFYDLDTDRPERPIEAWRALSRADVEAALRRHLHPSALKVTLGVPGG